MGALNTNAPNVLRNEALDYPMEGGACVFGSNKTVRPEKAILANNSAVREWDSNGTVFGYNAKLGAKHKAGEFGHNDFYGVVIAACQQKGLDGDVACRAMILLDEIRGRLSEVFSLKTYKIDHVVHGAIASVATYGALMGATAEQIECGIGMLVAHYIPWRAIRAGHQLSDSKGASAAISSEVAILCMLRAMKGFLGPRDIFRNPESIFRYFEPTKGSSPFDLVLSHSGDDFAIMGMHFKLGLYEHQSAGVLHGLVTLLDKYPEIVEQKIKSVRISAYEPAFGIIGDPAKRDPHTRQSADHSMVFIVARKLGKAMAIGKDSLASGIDNLWKQLILLPEDYGHRALFDSKTRELMKTISFVHDESYDAKYPDGIPSSITITAENGEDYDSGFIMYPGGHARNKTVDLQDILSNKFAKLGALAVKDVDGLLTKLNGLPSKSAADVRSIYNVPITFSNENIDEAPKSKL